MEKWKISKLVEVDVAVKAVELLWGHFDEIKRLVES
jgi:hypothetical protein